MDKDSMNAVEIGDKVKLVEVGQCPLCKKKILMNSFRDVLSFKEFKVSGVCQECQDDIFSGGEEK